MAIRMKKLIAVLTAAVILTAAVLDTAVYAAEAGNAEVAEGTESETQAAKSENVSEDGEVIMEGAVGKVDESEWVTFEDVFV